MGGCVSGLEEGQISLSRQRPDKKNCVTKEVHFDTPCQLAVEAYLGELKPPSSLDGIQSGRFLESGDATDVVTRRNIMIL